MRELKQIVAMNLVNCRRSSDMTQLLPAVFCMMMVAFSFSITYGFAFGMLSYVLLETFNGRGRRISPTAWIIFASMAAFVAIKI